VDADRQRESQTPIRSDPNPAISVDETLKLADDSFVTVLQLSGQRSQPVCHPLRGVQRQQPNPSGFLSEDSEKLGPRNEPRRTVA
jgi:hypothetical protein